MILFREKDFLHKDLDSVSKHRYSLLNHVVHQVGILLWHEMTQPLSNCAIPFTSVALGMTSQCCCSIEQVLLSCSGGECSSEQRAKILSHIFYFIMYWKKEPDYKHMLPFLFASLRLMFQLWITFSYIILYYTPLATTSMSNSSGRQVGGNTQHWGRSQQQTEGRWHINTHEGKLSNDPQLNVI